MKKMILFAIMFIATNNYTMEPEESNAKPPAFWKGGLLCFAVEDIGEEEENTFEEHKPSEIETETCSFSMLPIELQDYIAGYLTFNDRETETEFIERSKINKFEKFPHDYCKQLPNDDYFPSLETGSSSPGTLYTYNIARNRLALLTVFFNKKCDIVIIDTTKNETLYQNTIAQGNYEYLALSPDSSMFATLDVTTKKLPAGHRETIRYQTTTTLDIHSINSKDVQTYIVPDIFMLPKQTAHNSIAFNKQGTHVIINGTDLITSTLSANEVKKTPIEHHILIPITLEQPDKVIPVKTLQHYCEQKGICKQLQ